MGCILSDFANSSNNSGRDGENQGNINADYFGISNGFGTGVPSGAGIEEFVEVAVAFFQEVRGYLLGRGISFGDSNFNQSLPTNLSNDSDTRSDSTVTRYINLSSGDTTYLIGGTRFSRNHNDTLNRKYKMKKYVTDY